MRLPPLLLMGDAGVGKSHFCHVLTEALAMPFSFVPVAGASQELHITGLSKSWGGAGPSRFAEIMASLPMANPLIMVDEIDKASDIKVHNALLQIFEPETAARWVDQYVEVPIDLSRVMFVATANDSDALSSVLLSRFEVFDIEKPSATQLV
jgi:ATP-dependent Lon protease